MNYPAYGCGIRYRYGMFKQKIVDGYQVEKPDDWLKVGNMFEIRRDEYAKEVRFGGHVRFEKDPVTGRDRFIQETKKECTKSTLTTLMLPIPQKTMTL